MIIESVDLFTSGVEAIVVYDENNIEKEAQLEFK